MAKTITLREAQIIGPASIIEAKKKLEQARETLEKASDALETLEGADYDAVMDEDGLLIDIAGAILKTLKRIDELETLARWDREKKARAK